LGEFTLNKPDRNHAASDEFERLIEEIRGKDGSGSFLLAPEEIDMLFAATDGPLVVLNVSKYRCDAIPVEAENIDW
jgi:hypothetical protein